MLNLARRPFVNARPVVRISVLLWTLGAVLLAVNVWLFSSYTRDSAGRQAELELARERIGAAEGHITSLENEIERARLPQLAQQVNFLNLRITERTFGWGKLFDDLAAVLPWDVRIVSLSPVSLVPETPKERNESAVPRDRFRMTIDGTAQSDEALLQFLDALFKSSSFADPSLEREDRREGLLFHLSVTYFPAGDPGAERRSAKAADIPAVPPASAEPKS